VARRAARWHAGLRGLSSTRASTAQGTLIKRSPHQEEEPLKFFLFNDLLVWARHRKRDALYKMLGSVPLDDKFFIERAGIMKDRNCFKARGSGGGGADTAVTMVADWAPSVRADHLRPAELHRSRAVRQGHGAVVPRHRQVRRVGQWWRSEAAPSCCV
jgi:hypothetical protein